MGIGATILMIVAFPLNSLLLFQEGISGSNVQADVRSGISELRGGQMKETQVQKQPEPIRIKAQAVDEPKFKPVRKEDIKDLVLPNA
ncbi:MAG: hypothetical protein ACD_5C00079G0001, partial [uncultured bacterium]